MYSSTGDSYERSRFLDHAISDTLTAIDDSDNLLSAPGFARTMKRRLETAFILDYRDGQVFIPSSVDDDTDAIGIFAIRPGETVRGDFDSLPQTKEQRTKTVETLRRWEPAGDTNLQRFYEQQVVYCRPAPPSPFQLKETSGAIAFSKSSVVGVPESVAPSFTNAPQRGIALFHRKPLLILSMGSGPRDVIPEMITHELTHVDQFIRKPVDIITSQKNANMNTLRRELEAYHVGAALTQERFQRIGNRALHDNNYSLIQVTIEVIRRSNEIDPHDIFRPTPTIVAELEKAGLTHIYAQTIDYDRIASMMESAKRGEEIENSLWTF